MLNRQELVNYRKLRGVTQMAVAENCNVPLESIKKMEEGVMSVNPLRHDEYLKGVNKAYQLKKKLPPKPRKPKKKKSELEPAIKRKTTRRRKKKEV